MADNTQLPVPSTSGDVIATDDIGGVKYQRVKLIHGAVFFRTGVSSATAVKDVDCPVPKGQFVFIKPDNHMVVSLVCDTGLTATVWITPCMGQ